MTDLFSAYNSTQFNRRQVKDLLAAKDQKTIFNLFGMKVLGPWDEQYTLKTILERLCNAAQATVGMILMIEEEKRRLVFYEAVGINLSLNSIRNIAWSVNRQQHNFPEGMDKTHVFDQDCFTGRKGFRFEKSMGFKSLCFQPLCMEGQILGAVLLGNRKDTIDFSTEDIEHLAAEALSVGAEIERVWLYRELKSMVINMMHAFVTTIEAKDQYTRGHSERVTKYSMIMARLLGWPQESLDMLQMSAILHDIGKIGVPEAILLKPGKLTDKEYSIIKKHPINGAQIVEKVPQFQHSLSGILFHHERYDGKGYPQGLQGTDIPEFGRLIAVADAFDAMTSNRSYRTERLAKDALEELRVNRGKQFDPEMVDVFLQGYAQGAMK